MKNYNAPYNRMESQIERIDRSIQRNTVQNTPVQMSSLTRANHAKQQAVKAGEDVDKLFARLGIKS